MPISSYQAPDIYVEEMPGGARPIQAVGTSTAGFVGVAPKADAFVNVAVGINNWSQFVDRYVATRARPCRTPFTAGSRMGAACAMSATSGRAVPSPGAGGTKSGWMCSPPLTNSPLSWPPATPTRPATPLCWPTAKG